jgi:signal transduction histidine kinase
MRSYIALADAFAGAGKYDSVYSVSSKGLSMAKRFNQLFPIGKFQLLLGAYHDHTMNYDSSVYYYTSAHKAFDAINLGYETSLALFHIGHANLQRKNFEIAAEYLKQALAKGRSLKLDQVIRRCLMDLALAEEHLGNERESNRYLKEYITVNDTIVQRNNRKLVYDLETKYQVKEKEAQLMLQQNEIRQRTMLNYLLAGTVISIIIITFSMYYAFRQRRRFQDQRIRELEQEKQLMASEAIIKGQEEERGRLAKDLHDGLGGLLSGVKYSLTNMKSTVVIDADSAMVFERSLDMLDHSIAELRRVAHNMMPEVLVRFGLAEAIKSYCDSVHQSGIVEVNFQEVGPVKRFKSNKEIMVYRIIQELLNNAAKHAQATRVLVQLDGVDNELIVTVEDNGQGFDASHQENKGSGLTSIQSRMDYLQGVMDIKSDPGHGTSFQLTVPI